MIDDERLQELLAKASSLYNSGEYKGAIEAWQEALGVDPNSQKAREGIRMATLLLGDFDAPPAAPPGAAAAPADGADPADAGAPPEETEARVDLGIARVKQLIAERKYAEAIEGAQGLQPLAPDSPEVATLLEEAQNAFESTPFVEEHLTLARELLAQERFAEAETECKKVFTLDATHPGAKDLLKEIRDKIQASLKAAASQLGGMTVKLTMPQAIAAGIKLRSTPTPSAPEPPAEAAAEPAAQPAAPGPDVPLPPSGEGAMAQEEVAARAALEAAFSDPALGGGPSEEESPFELGGIGPGAIGASAAPAAMEEPEVVEAQTVRPSSSRVVPRQEPPRPAPEPPAAVAAPPVVPAKAPGKPPNVRKTGPIPAVQAPAKPAAAGPAAKPATPAPGKAAPQKEAPAGAVPVAQVGDDAMAAWESELTQLNLKEKERGLLRGTGAKPSGKVDTGEMDIMSLLDTGMPGLPGGETPSPEPVPLAKAKEKPAARPAAAKPQPAPAVHQAPAEHAEPAPATKLRKPERPRPVPVRSSGGFPFMKVLLLLIVLLGGGGAAVYYLRPDLIARYAPQLLPYLPGGAGQPAGPVTPPAGAPAGAAEGAHPPIPTPIGGPSRQQTAPPPDDGAAVATTSPATHAAGVAPPPVAARPATTPSTEPIKPAVAPALSKEEIQRRVASFTADGRRLLAAGKWREARAQFNAVLALDPANMVVKDLADQAQAKIDDNQKLQDEFDSTKRAYADKDYENALRMLYRLPRDKGFGDIDLYIRNAWYNWAVVLMKAGNTRDALVKLSEGLTVDPDDAAALKLQEVGEKYSNRAKDRTYYAFTDALTLRDIDQKK